MSSNKKQFFLSDPAFLIFLFILIVVGLIIDYSVICFNSISQNENIFVPLIELFIWAGVGVVCFFIFSRISYSVYKKTAMLLLVVAIFLLLMVLLTPMGMSINGAKRWLDFKYFTMMPGEPAKIALVVFIANFFDNRRRQKPIFMQDVFPVYFWMGVLFLLIYVQPNLSTGLIIIIIGVGMMFASGVQFRHIILPCILGAAALTVALILRGGFHIQRFTSFTDPFTDERGAGYQVAQSIRAIASGGFFGKGLGVRTFSSSYIPEVENDFIFASICEQFGIVGGVGVLIIYLLFIYRAIKIAINAPDKFSFLLASGISIMFSFQVIFNIMVVTAMMPPTGIILPFISKGGTATLFFMASCGILYNISLKSRTIKNGK